MYLKLRVDCLRVGDDLINNNWSGVYSNLNSVIELNKAVTCLIDRRVLSKVIRRKVNDKAWFNEYCINAFIIKKYILF